MKLKLITKIAILFCISSHFALISAQEKDGLFRPGAKLEKLAGDFLFTEGPAADSKGNVFFTDQPNNRIMIWTIGEKLEPFMQPCGRANGLFFDKKGNLLACADENNEIWQIGPDKKVTVIAGLFLNRPYNGPNDLWISRNGGIYFTDPYYQRPWWNHNTMPQEKQCVYYLRPDYRKVIKVAEDLEKPNGIIGTPDGKKLYVADIGGKKIWSYFISSDGSLKNKTLFCEMGSDGMTIDEYGDIYLTGNGVTIFDKSGKQICNVPVPEKWTANVCFGGSDGRSLFITASTGLYRMKMSVHGALR